MGTPWHLYYDGGCNLCHASKLKVEHWAERRGIPFVAVPIQTMPDPPTADPNAMILDVEGLRYEGSDAWLKLMEIAPPGLRWLRFFGRTAPTRALARLGYAVVARPRHRLFGRRTCELPRPR